MIGKGHEAVRRGELRASMLSQTERLSENDRLRWLCDHVYEYIDRLKGFVDATDDTEPWIHGDLFFAVDEGTTLLAEQPAFVRLKAEGTTETIQYLDVLRETRTGDRRASSRLLSSFDSLRKRLLK